MKHNMKFAHTGKCFVCGKDTKLPIHADCCKQLEEQRKPKNKKKQKYSDGFSGYLSGLDK
jgi:hypothetical protein